MRGNPLFSASMMCANYANLSQVVQELERSGIDSFHIDIMDGEFVDNFGMGYQDMAFIRSATKKELDVHLMVLKPILYLPMLYELGVNAIYIHPEADKDPATTIEKIQKHGMQAGIAINPGTSVSFVEELLNTADRVLVLGVNPGHAGRTYQNYVDKKIEKLLSIRSEQSFQIWLDGAVSKERAAYWAKKGVDGFILGTSCLFKKTGESFYSAMSNLRATVGTSAI